VRDNQMIGVIERDEALRMFCGSVDILVALSKCRHGFVDAVRMHYQQRRFERRIGDPVEDGAAPGGRR
jgi:hypothetical protein